MCLKCGKVIKDPYLYKVAPEQMELNVRLKGSIVSEFGTTKLEELKSKSDDYTGKFEPVDDDASGEFETRDDTTVHFDSGMYSMPRTQTKRISTATKTYAIGLTILAFLATLVVVVGIQMLSGDEQAREELDTAGDGNTRIERWESGGIKTEWSVSSAQGGEVPDGPWTEYHRDGEKALQGQYSMGARVGNWIAWHENGREAMRSTYANDKLTGKWTEWHSSGAKSVEGEYVKGEKHGEWRTWYRGGELESVQNYDHGSPVGEAIALWPDGLRKSTGRWEEGRRIGRWVSYHDNAVIEKVENWNDGILDGETFANHRNRHKSLEGQWSEGLKVGEWKWWHATGEPAKQGAFDNGVETGKWREWYVTGDLKAEGGYDKGLKHGEWLQYDEGGDLAARREFNQGILESEQYFFKGAEVDYHVRQHEDGTVREEWTTFPGGTGDSARHGWYRNYYLGGQLAEIGQYVNGKKDGTWRTYDHDGVLLHQARFEDGREIQ